MWDFPGATISTTGTVTTVSSTGVSFSTARGPPDPTTLGPATTSASDGPSTGSGPPPTPTDSVDVTFLYKS